MSRNSKIEWCDTTWNVVTGCTKVSEGCRNCYAETMASRFWGDRKFTDVRIHPERLKQPLDWKKPARVFVNSMSDLFHKDIPFEFIDEVFHIMRVADRHTFLILTKRPDIMLKFIDWQKKNTVRFDWRSAHKNIWLGVSVENQKTADERIPLLLQTPAAVRFVSCEPLLGEIDLKGWIYKNGMWVDGQKRIDWVIVGGESGKNARPMHPDWARSIRDQCVDAGVPFFFKQWGEWHPEFIEPGVCRVCGCSEFDPCEVKGGCYWVSNRLCSTCKNVPFVVFSDSKKDSGQVCFRVKKNIAGRLLDGREWNEFPMSESAEVG